MLRVFDNHFFSKLNRDEIKQWIKNNYTLLIGSAIFTKNNSITSKVVRWAESWKCEDKSFIPSHTGSIIEYNNEIYIFDMKPLRASVQPLLDYLCDTKDDYKIILRNFEINTHTFNSLIIDKIGELYPFMSAIRSVFTKRRTKYKQHCSEAHARCLKLSGYEFKEGFNFECTPEELYNYFI